MLHTRLEGHDQNFDIGVLRLRFAGPVRLSEREQYTLRTFASALCTAVRNAQAYAELARIAEEHAYAATHDALTGLSNRRHLLDEGTEQLTNRHADGVTALVLIDLNHFKEINDTLGHGAGDRVLIAGRRPAARRGLPGRPGGPARRRRVRRTAARAARPGGGRAPGRRAARRPARAARPGRHADQRGGQRRYRRRASQRRDARAAAPGRRGDVPGQAVAAGGSPRTHRPATPPTWAGSPSAANCPARSPTTSSPSTSSRSSTWAAAR